MDRVTRLARAFRSNPRYVLVRALARFVPVRRTATWVLGRVRRKATATHVRGLDARQAATMFPGLDVELFVDRLRHEGTATGLRLPEEVVSEVGAFAESAPCFADRETSKGFHLGDRARAQAEIGKPILVAQYFNTEAGCDAIRRVRDDATIQRIASRYLGSRPTMVGVDLWWTFPVDATEADRSRHAHLFHRDVDDFRFVKFFFYLSDVGSSDGPHVTVLGSHRRALAGGIAGRLSLRRLTDDEVVQRFGAASVLPILGKAGDGFAEDTFCVHKGTTPVAGPRLILQLEFALFDYGNAHDRRPADELELLA